MKIIPSKSQVIKPTNQGKTTMQSKLDTTVIIDGNLLQTVELPHNLHAVILVENYEDKTASNIGHIVGSIKKVRLSNKSIWLVPMISDTKIMDTSVKYRIDTLTTMEVKDRLISCATALYNCYRSYYS